jgi:phosphonate transport system substrate-binding protein
MTLWAPYLNYLEKKTDIKLELKFYSNIGSFERGFLNAESDFVFINPYHAVMAKKAHGYIPLLRDGSKQLKGILVVLKEGDIDDIQKLDGKKIAFPSPNAFGASLYMRALLAKEKKIKIVPVYVKTHDNVYLNVVNETTAAGGGVGRTLNHQEDYIKEELNILYKTPGVAPHPLAAHPRVSKEDRKAIIEATLALINEADGAEKLKKIKLKQPIKADYTTDYATLESLGLEEFVAKGASQKNNSNKHHATY